MALITGSAGHIPYAVFMADDGVLRYEGGTRIFVDTVPVSGDTHAVLMFDTGFSMSYDNSVCDYRYGSLDALPPTPLSATTALQLISDYHSNLYLCPKGYLRARTTLALPTAEKADMRYTCHVSADTRLLDLVSESASLADSWYILRPQGRSCRVPSMASAPKEMSADLPFDNLQGKGKDCYKYPAWSEARDQYYLSAYSWGTLGLFDSLLATGSGVLPLRDSAVSGGWTEIFRYDQLPKYLWGSSDCLDLASSSTYRGLLDVFDWFTRIPWGDSAVFDFISYSTWCSPLWKDRLKEIITARNICYLMPWLLSELPDGGNLLLNFSDKVVPGRVMETLIYPAMGALYERSQAVLMDTPRNIYHDSMALTYDLPPQSTSDGFRAVHLLEDDRYWLEGDTLKSWQSLGTPIPGYMETAAGANLDLDTPLHRTIMVPSPGCFDRPQDNYTNPPADVIIIPHPLVIKRSLQLMSTASLVRASDNAPIPVTSMSLGTDLQSWCWSFSANVKTAAGLELCKPVSADPVELIATVNGYSWRVLIDGYNEKGAFGKTDYSISGRTKAVELASPMAEPGSRVFDAAMNLSQIFEQELLRIQGMNDGEWTGIWEAQDGLIPADTFSYQDKTPIEVIMTLAQAVGAFVHHDRLQRIIKVSPCYSKNPWDFTIGDEDHALHPSSVISTGMSWKPTPVKDGVYVSGTTADGYLCKVARNGSGGLKQLPMITDPLIVTAAIARERGRFAINQTGKKGDYSKELPILAPDSNLPLLETGRVVRVDDAVPWYGVITGLSVGVSMSNNVCKARQQVSIERHFE